MFYYFKQVETTPGAGAEHPFAPPAGWTGDESEYLALMRARFLDMNYRPVLLAWARAYARDQDSVEFTGPMVNPAKRVLESLYP
ncbi:MAG: hypothetical protein B7Z66_12255 [Chromatiales bacterium 21-64-14]|nr:MAG: hypothetical protein B7Z66_12255 [Chromatiales bacterium 21-64-14]HQU15491.1 hypothetical protein [Gammaproteobacteria bacterium]